MNTNWLPRIDASVGPKHQSIKQSIRAAIADGTILPGHRLPPVREVAWRLGVTPGTVARAYKDLVDDGALDAQVGRGTFVAEPGSVSLAVEPCPHLPRAPMRAIQRQATTRSCGHCSPTGSAGPTTGRCRPTTWCSRSARNTRSSCS